MTRALKNTTAKTGKGGNQELALTDNFAGVVLKKSDGGLTIDISALNGVDLTVIVNGKVISSSLAVKSFKPDNAMIRAGQVELHKISQHLRDFFRIDAKAELLVAPQDLANIDGQGLGTWEHTIERIRKIKGYHGLDGMKIFDRTEEYTSISYEHSLSSHIRAAWEQAKRTGRPVTTGLFLGTKELVHGRRMDSNELTVEANLYSLKKEIGQKGEEFITSSSSSYNGWRQWTCTQTTHYSLACHVNFTDYDDEIRNHSDGDPYSWCYKNQRRLSARPVALILQP